MSELKSSKSINCSKRVVRVIGRIRGFTEKESKLNAQESEPWITVKNSTDNGCSENSTVCFVAQSTGRTDSYELDYCYKPDEEICSMYSKEIRNMILDVFDGHNASIIALGARGSGKTYTIQGSQEKPGLAVIAMTEILSKAKELGRSVSLSLYEMTQDHAYDCLDPKHPEVQVLEGASGIIKLKGLSQVPVKSISEFYAMYLNPSNLQKTRKTSMVHPRKHKGLMIYISSKDSKIKTKMANKINFVDLAGYEDPKKGGGDGTTLAEINRTNKSLYALLNLVNALNTNETRLPYRESKLTRILQDSLGGTNSILLLTCLNCTFCQDTVSSMSLVSRSYRGSKKVLTDSTNKNYSIGKAMEVSSFKGGKTMSASLSVKKPVGHNRLHALKKSSGTLNGRILFDEEKGMSASLSVKKPVGHDSLHALKKSGGTLNGRILFDEEKRMKLKQLKCRSPDTSSQKSKILPPHSLVVAPLSLEEAPPHKSISENIEMIKDNSFEGIECKGVPKMDASSQSSYENYAVSLAEKDVSPCTRIDPVDATEDISLDVNALTLYKAVGTSDAFHEEDKSPPLSETIKQISNKLKSLCSSTPLRINMQETYKSQDVLEPKTPSMGVGTFSNRSSGMKHCLVQEYLNFLNSATRDELKGLKGIGEKRASYILELREQSPEPFKNLDDLQDIGLSAKQVKSMMKQAAGELFN